MTVMELLTKVSTMLESGGDPSEILATVERYGDLRADEALSAGRTGAGQ